MKFQIVVGTLAVGLLPLATFAQEAHLNLSYGEGERNVLDLFLPEGVENPPLVMYIHGGAWFRGDKTQVEDYERRAKMNAAGIAVASINHTWSQQAVWPAQKHDVEAAIRYLQESADQFGYDMSKFGVWGQSSGAHLALWAGVLDGEDESLGVDAVVSWYAPSNMYMLFHDRENDDVPGGNERTRFPTPEDNLMGVAVLENKDIGNLASPDMHLQSKDGATDVPPTLLVHGTMDNRVSPLQSQRIYDAFSDHGVEVELVYVEGGKHGGEPFNAYVDPSIAFLMEHMNAE